MKTNIKIYDGITIDMGTSQIIETGKVSYVNASDVSYTKGGGNKGSATTTTGFDPKHSAAITGMLGDGKSLYDSGALGKVSDTETFQLRPVIVEKQLRYFTAFKSLLNSQIGSTWRQ